MSNKVSGPCPKCGQEDLRMTVKQGDHMRVTGGPTLRVTVWGEIICADARLDHDPPCDYREQSALRDIILEFGEAA